MLSSKIFKLSVLTFIIFLNLSLVTAASSLQEHYLPLSYFVCVSVLVLLISVQIVFSEFVSKGKICLILLEILVVSGLVGAAPLLLFPGSYGNDSSFHVAAIQYLLDFGHVGSFGQYTNEPGFQLIFAAISLFSNIEAVKSVQVVVSQIEAAVVVLFVFVTVRTIFTSRAALLSSLLVSLSSYVLVARFSYYPSNFAVIFFIIVVSLLALSSKEKGSSYPYLILILIATLALMLTHPVGSLVLIVVEALMLLALRTLKTKHRLISITVLLLFVVIIFSWWTLPYPGASSGLIANFINNLIGATSGGVSEVQSATLAPTFSTYDVWLIDLGVAALTFLGLIGSFYVIGRRQNRAQDAALSNSSSATILSITTLLLVPVPFIIAIVAPKSLPDRWFVFTQLLLGLFAGSAVLAISSKLPGNKKKLLLTLALTCCVFFMITVPLANPNEQLYSTALSGRAALTQPEMDAAGFFKPFNQSSLSADVQYIGLLGSPNVETKFLDPDNPDSYQEGIVAVRTHSLDIGFVIPTYGEGGVLLRVVHPTQQFYTFLENNASRLYDNNQVTVYYSGPSSPR